ncbi:hypothetical protein, partial [Salmonella sp. s57610]|uniref:hypothetical protein n=1 Tax=Salmonella sp. s57610 TaxID=3159697 RepID=UPI00397FCBD9
MEMVEEEFKKFGTIQPGGVQLRHNQVDRFGFGFVESESQQSMQAAIEASRNEQGYYIFIKNLPFHDNMEMVEEEFKKFGTIKPGGVQVR